MKRKGVFYVKGIAENKQGMWQNKNKKDPKVVTDKITNTIMERLYGLKKKIAK